MPSQRELFLSHVGQTSEFPSMLEVDRAEGLYIYDVNGKEYMDMNSGISVSVLGHRYPKVVDAIKDQADKYMHTMVYGEHIQNPQVSYAALLAGQLEKKLDSIYYANSGSEAVEIALKLAKRCNGRYELVSCKNAYHGSTQGAEGLRSDHEYSRTFLPLIPGYRHIGFNDINDLEKITNCTSAVVMELVQAEAGVVLPDPRFLKRLSKRCQETGALLIVDEIQTGFGRTGSLFAHQKYGIDPDILLIGKGMGGGMPISGVVSSREKLNLFTKNPSLGHITTFGGHPVTCAAAKATLEVLLERDLIRQVNKKEALIHELLKHEIIEEIRSAGLMMAVELTKRKYLKHVVENCRSNGLIIDYFLFNNKSFRLYPPLIISEEQIKIGCGILSNSMDYALTKYAKN